MLLSIHRRQIRKASPVQKPLSRGLLWPGCSLRVLGCALFQAEPLPEACSLRGFWPRSSILLQSNTSTLLLNSSFLRIHGPAAWIRVTGGKAPPVSCHRPHLLQRVKGEEARGAETGPAARGGTIHRLWRESHLCHLLTGRP